jgi:hypothetical protein
LRGDGFAEGGRVSDAYKGESPGKKFARFAYWQSVALEMGAQFNAGKHLFLASREGGDFGVLRAMGLPFDLLVGVDRNELALRECDQKWSAIARARGEEPPIFQLGSIDEEVNHYEREEGPVASVFLDFCCHLDRASLLTTCNSFLALRPGSVIGVAFLKGREKQQHEQRVAVIGNRNQRRALRARVGGWRRELLGMMDGSRAWDMIELMRRIRASTPAAATPRAVRWQIVDAVLTAAGRYREAEPVGAIEYHSRTKEGGGVPMLMMLFRVRHAGAADHQRVPWHIEEPQDTNAWVRKSALAIGVDGALAMNLDPRTVAAWRAHATRGTYSIATSEGRVRQ